MSFRLQQATSNLNSEELFSKQTELHRSLLDTPDTENVLQESVPAVRVVVPA